MIMKKTQEKEKNLIKWKFQSCGKGEKLNKLQALQSKELATMAKQLKKEKMK